MSKICGKEGAPTICYDEGDASGCIVIGTNTAETTFNELQSEYGATHLDMFAQMDSRLKYLSEKGRLRCPDYMNNEHDGFYAVKTRKGLRAYGWFEQCAGKKCFIISHFIFKKQQKLASEDKNKMKKVKDMWSNNRWPGC